MASDEEDHKELISRAKKLHAAIDCAVKGFPTSIGNGDSIDRFTDAAKNFAAHLLAERIQQSFANTINPVTGQSTETSLDEKLEHAREIRDWLVQWNFAFVHPRTGECYQLHAMSTGPCGSKGGTYTATHYGSNAKISAWPQVRAMVTDWSLGDISRYMSRSSSRTR